MKKQDSFNGWDFTRTWTMDTGQTYPYLSGQAFFRDMAPPVFIDGCPSADNIGSASFYLQVSTDENANVYYVVLADGAQGPTSLQIKAGQDASGTNLAAGRKGSLTVTAGSMSAKAVTGLTVTTPYDIYLAAEDTRGNLSILPAKLDVSTSSFSNENDITDFTVTGQTGASAIDTAGHTVEFHMPYGTNAASLTPTIAVSANAVIEPASGTAQDFTGPVYYTVTAQNGTPQVWTVTCIVDPAVIDAGKSTVSAQTTPASPAVNTIFIFTVNVHDAADIPIIGLAAGDFIITGDGSGSLTVDSITENGTAGGYTVAATYDTAETIAITVKVSGVEIGSITNVIIQNLSGFDVSASPGEKTADTPFDLSIANAKGMDGCYLNGNISVIVISDKDGEIHNAVVTVTTGAAIVPVTLTSAGNHMLTVTMTGVTDPENITVSIVPAVTYGNISGTVSYIDEGGGTGPLPGAMVTVASVGADYSAATTTAADGTYILTSVPAGTGYTVTAVKTGYVSKMTDDVTVTSGSAVTVNFALTANAIPSVNSVPNRKSDIPEATTARVTAYTAYTLDLSTIFEDELPASSLSGSQSASGPQGTGALTFSAPYGSIAITGDMLAGMAGTEGKKAGITIAQGDKSGLPEDVQAAIGDRPIVRLTLALDGRQTDWNNPDAPVTVNIPYTPTTEELASPEGIVIWYIDGSGNTVCIPNGRYDPVTGTVTFTAAHFSYYAVSYKKTGFKDVAKDAWYYKAVSFIAAREITLGTGGGNFSPDAKLTRGQFIVMLMRAYGIEPDADPDPNDNFADAGNTYYTGYLAAARRLGISAGVGNNMFAPEKEITRQEMFKLLYNALKVIGKLSGSSSEKTLSDFSDADEVAAWAYDAVKLFVESGIINGSGGKLDPLSTTTRGQMAQVLYILL